MAARRCAPPDARAGSCAPRGADVVLGGGGYVAGPVGLAARSLRLPLALTEADSHLGVTNRLLAPLARRVFLSFPIEGRDGPQVRGHAAGPVPPRHRERSTRRPRAGASTCRPRCRACSCSAARSARAA